MIKKISLVAISALALAACNDQASTGGAAGGSRQEIRIVGSSTVFPFAKAASEAFAKADPSRKSPVLESTGTGGGIFLTPLLLFCCWAKVKEAAAVSSLFILVNSSSGLAGYVRSGRELPDFAWPLAAVVAVGGFIGARLGSRHLPVRSIAVLLAVVLVIAGTKLVLG